MKQIRLLLVDDDRRVRQGLRMRMACEPDINVVGEAGDGAAALRLAPALQPDVIVVDLLMPHMDGFQVTRQLHLLAPDRPIVALSVHEDVRTRQRAAAAGAAAFVAKQEGPEQLLAVIRLVARHG